METRALVAREGTRTVHVRRRASGAQRARLAALALTLAATLAGCGRGERRRRPAGRDRRGGGRERVRERDRADRRPLREGERGGEQPEHRPAHRSRRARAWRRRSPRRAWWYRTAPATTRTWKRSSRARRAPRARSSTSRSCSGCRTRFPTRTSGTGRQTMPAVAGAIARDLATLEPAHAGNFRTRAERFEASLAPWTQALAALRRELSGGAGRGHESRSATTCSKRRARASSRHSRCRRT